jgi:hypothetical protein
MNQKEIIKRSMSKLENWVEVNNYKGYEPFDGLLSYLRFFTFKNLFLERILQQTVRLSPINFRPILGIKPQESTKGRGYMVQGYLINWKETQELVYKKRAIDCLKWLDENKSPFYKNHSWANHFDVSFRGGNDPKHEPIIVWTSIIGQAFLDAYEILGDKNYLKIGESVSRFILDLPREKTENGVCISYIKKYQRSIHNANMLGAAFLSRYSRLSGDKEAKTLSRDAMEYSCTRQLSDGSWYYGEADHYHWIDNFHTGYNLDSLKCYIINSQDKTWEENLKKGIDFYKNHFIENDGKPKYYHNKTYPVDIQCAAQTIETLANCSDIDSSLLDVAINSAIWTIENMQDTQGYFIFRKLPKYSIKTPMLHWGQATMYKALSLLLSKMK